MISLPEFLKMVDNLEKAMIEYQTTPKGKKAAAARKLELARNTLHNQIMSLY